MKRVPPGVIIRSMGNGQDQLGLFDRAAGERLREAAIAQVDGHATPEWKDAALAAVSACARECDEFIVDEVWKHLADGLVTHDLRAMGPVMRRAAGAGWIEPTTRFRLSERASSHRNPRRIWRSLLRGGAGVREPGASREPQEGREP